MFQYFSKLVDRRIHKSTIILGNMQYFQYKLDNTIKTYNPFRYIFIFKKCNIPGTFILWARCIS